MQGQIVDGYSMTLLVGMCISVLVLYFIFVLIPELFVKLFRRNRKEEV